MKIQNSKVNLTCLLKKSYQNAYTTFLQVNKVPMFTEKKMKKTFHVNWIELPELLNQITKELPTELQQSIMQ
jgi:hypothetical protein